jgi:hypothetical protein
MQLKFMDEEAIQKSRKIDISAVKSVCLMLGPYRNLTTMTAATLYLHNNCQVLNHAGERIYGKHKVDFLQNNFQVKRLDRFIQYAILISAGGFRGKRGGSITHSHAFTEEYGFPMKEDKNRPPLVKNEIQCLLWKESLRTSLIIRQRKIDFDHVFSKDKRLRFLLPVRDPIHCAFGNIKSGHINMYENNKKSPDIFYSLDLVLTEIFWIARLKRSYPNRFHYFFEHSISKEMIRKLANFLELKDENEWLEDAIKVMRPKSNYKTNKSLINYYLERVEDYSSEFPVLVDKLKLFYK